MRTTENLVSIRITKKKLWLYPARARKNLEGTLPLELDARVELQRLATTARVRLSEVGVSDGEGLKVPAGPVEWVRPGHGELEKPLLAPKRKPLAHAEVLA
jgi:hypothetical protein